MAEEYKCGPETDADFFNELGAVFDKFPDAAQKYSIHCMSYEKDRLGVDFAKQIAISRIEGNQMITEFQDIGYEGPSARFPCSWCRSEEGVFRGCGSCDPFT
jgi:hypothetical protein